MHKHIALHSAVGLFLVAICISVKAKPGDVWVSDPIGGQQNEPMASGGDDLFRLHSSDSRCISSADQLSLTLRRMKIPKDQSMRILSKDKEVAVRIDAGVSLRDIKTRQDEVTTVTTLYTHDVEVLQGDTVVLPVEIPIAHLFPLRTDRYTINYLDVKLSLHVKRRAAEFGKLIQSFKNFEPLTSLLLAAANPYVGVLGKFAGVALDESINDINNISKAVFAGRALVSISPDGKCSGSESGYAQTGVLALVRRLNDLSPKCIRPNFDGTFSLQGLIGKAVAADCKNAGSTQFSEISNPYLMFAISAFRSVPPISEIAKGVGIDEKELTATIPTKPVAWPSTGASSSKDVGAAPSGVMSSDTPSYDTYGYNAASSGGYERHQKVQEILHERIKVEQERAEADNNLCAVVQGNVARCRP